MKRAVLDLTKNKFSTTPLESTIRQFGKWRSSENTSFLKAPLPP